MLCMVSLLVYTMRGNLVINQVTPHTCRCICTSLRHFLFSLLSTYTHKYIHASKPLNCISKTRSREFLNPQNHTQILSILCFDTCFEIPSPRVFFSYQNINDPSLFFVRAFRNLWTSRLVLNVICVSKICETDTIIIRISRGTTYYKFIEI